MRAMESPAARKIPFFVQDFAEAGLKSQAGNEARRETFPAASGAKAGKEER
jgi:hypothetical protein